MSLPLREIVVCSLEPWDEVWRRNQFFVDNLMRLLPELRILFVEPAADPLHDLKTGRRPAWPHLRPLSPDRRLRGLRPLKPFPRRVGHLADGALLLQVTLAARAFGFVRPTLWINDVTYAPLIEATGWPSLYDVTDDWLLAPFPEREIARLRGLEAVALAEADEVVVCSPALAVTRGEARDVTLVSNGVDVDHFRRVTQRPRDLPPAPTAVYVGTLHESRLDVDLVVEVARAQPALSIVLVGPDSLSTLAQRKLLAEPNVHLRGPRPYAEVPAYLQHADVILVPHKVSPFTESLDPIKAYECAVVDVPTVATPVAGFRELSGLFTVAAGGAFIEGVARALASGTAGRTSTIIPAGWDQRAGEFAACLARAGARTQAARRTSAAGVR